MTAQYGGVVQPAIPGQVAFVHANGDVCDSLYKITLNSQLWRESLGDDRVQKCSPCIEDLRRSCRLLS